MSYVFYPIVMVEKYTLLTHSVGKVSTETKNYGCQDWNFLTISEIKDSVPCLDS